MAKTGIHIGRGYAGRSLPFRMPHIEKIVQVDMETCLTTSIPCQHYVQLEGYDERVLWYGDQIYQNLYENDEEIPKHFEVYKNDVLDEMLEELAYTDMCYCTYPCSHNVRLTMVSGKEQTTQMSGNQIFLWFYLNGMDVPKHFETYRNDEVTAIELKKNNLEYFKKLDDETKMSAKVWNKVLAHGESKTRDYLIEWRCGTQNDILGTLEILLSRGIDYQGLKEFCEKWIISKNNSGVITENCEKMLKCVAMSRTKDKWDMYKYLFTTFNLEPPTSFWDQLFRAKLPEVREILDLVVECYDVPEQRIIELSTYQIAMYKYFVSNDLITPQPGHKCWVPYHRELFAQALQTGDKDKLEYYTKDMTDISIFDMESEITNIASADFLLDNGHINQSWYDEIVLKILTK